MALVHILDRQTDAIVGTLSLKNAEFWSAIRKDSLENENTFDFKANASLEKSTLLEKRNRLLIQDEDGFFHEYIIFYSEQYSQTEKDVSSNASFTDLAKAKVIEAQTLQGATSYSATQTALLGTEWQPGDIEFTFIRSIKIEDYTNPLDLLKLIASTFGLEIRYRIEISGNKIVGRYVDMKKQIAGFEGKEIAFGKDLVGVKRKEDGNPIVTALRGYGPVKADGSRLSVLVEDKDALQRWGRNGQHLIEPYEPQSSDSDMTLERLKTLTQNELKKRIDAIVTYECEAVSLEHIKGFSHEKIRVGQTVRIKDDGYKPPLYVEGRIQAVEVDQVTHQIKTFKIGNFIEYKKSDLEKQIASLKNNINDKISKMVSLSVTSSSGNVFKNDAWAETTLTARVFLAGQEIDLDGTRFTYRWTLYDKDGALISDWEAGKTIGVESQEVDEKLVIKVSIISNGNVLFVDEITLFKVSDGEKGDTGDKGLPGSPGTPGKDGVTLYTWIKYADTPTTGMSDMSDNKKYVGIAANKTTPTKSSIYSDYTWSLIKGDTGAPGTPGSDAQSKYTWVMYANDNVGSGITSNPAGKLWRGFAYNKTTPTPSTIPSDYAWQFITDGWIKAGTVKIDGGNIYADVLSAISANLGNVIAGHIMGVTLDLANGKLVIDNQGNATFGGKISTDDILIKRGLNGQAQIIMEMPSGGYLWLFTGMTGVNWLQYQDNLNNFYNIAAFNKDYFDIRAPLLRASKIEGLSGSTPEFTLGLKANSINSVSGNPISMPNGIANASWTDCSLYNGWVAVAGSTPQFLKQADGMVLVRGAIMNGTFGTGYPAIALPAGCRPERDLFVAGIDFGNKSVSIGVRTNGGYIQIYDTSPASVDKRYVSLDGIRFLGI